jgi:hypothetical protein
LRVRLFAESGKTLDIDEEDVGQFRSSIFAPFGWLQPIDADEVVIIGDWARNLAGATRNMDQSNRLRAVASFLFASKVVVKIEQL